MAPCATFSASTTSSTGMPPAGVTVGTNTSNCGDPLTLPDCGVTAKATAFETCGAFAAEPVIVPAVLTSCAGTGTASATQFPPRQFAGVAELGVRAAPPKFT